MTPVAGAWSNRVYRLTTSVGVYAVKHLRNPWNVARWLEWLDAAWTLEARAHLAGIRMPEPVPNPADGGCVAWVESVAGTDPIPVRVHRWMDGSALPPEPVGSEVAAWAGATLATVHGLQVTTSDRTIFPIFNTDTADQWPELVSKARAAHAAWAADLWELRPHAGRIAELAQEAGSTDEPEVMCHGDIDQKNIVLAPDGPVLCDWDVAMPLVPRRELADVALSLAGWRHLDVAREVVRAYRCAGGAAEEIHPADLGPAMSTRLDWLAFNVERAIGTRSAAVDEVALSRRLVPELIRDVPRQLAVALRWPEKLAG
nr:aminoglycoside phosphotransferase family protein [Phytoactinopolyspora alkaliphila]